MLQSTLTQRPTLPKFELFSPVIVRTVLDNRPNEDRGIIHGMAYGMEGFAPGWWYWVVFPELTHSPHMPPGSGDWCPEDEIWE